MYRQLLAIAPDEVWNSIRVARRLEDLGRLDEAHGVLRAAEERFVSSPDLLGERIRILRESGQSYQALDTARAAQAAHPAHFGRWCDRFEWELKLSSIEAAEACIDLAPAQNCAEDVQVLCARARLALRMHDTDQAAARFEAALSLQPDSKAVRRALVKAVNAINRGDRDKVWMLTGPGLLSRAFAGEMAEAGEGWPAWLGRMAIRDEADIHPRVAIHCRTSHKKLGKHWSQTAFAQSEGRSTVVAG